MRVLVQRVLNASVSIDGKVVGEIEKGLLLFVGFASGDGEKEVHSLAGKAVHLRIFPDDRDRLQYSILEYGGAVLVVPQFTLYSNTSRGRRPDFSDALAPNLAEPLFLSYIAALEKLLGNKVERGCFGANMQVELLNDGPFTVLLDSGKSAH